VSYAGKEVMQMKYKDMNACIAVLQAIHRRDDTEPEQKRNIEVAIERLRVLRRLDHPSRAEVFRHIREITERIIRAFLK